MSIKKHVRDFVIPSEERHLSMYLMDFEEFLGALGNETLMDLIRRCFIDTKSMGQAMHRKSHGLVPAVSCRWGYAPSG
ncbi:MAG: hypothetical protein AB7C91_12840 [Sphaerochaeta sp.]